MEQKEKKSGPVGSVNTALWIVETLKESEGATVTELSDRLDLAKSTVHDHLATLKEHGYIIQDDREYRLSLKLLGLGTWVKSNKRITNAARPVLKRLAEKTKLAAWLIVEENGYAVGIEREIGEEFKISAPRPGERSYMHNQAGGKAILAHLPPGRVDEILETHGLPASTEHTITDPDELRGELEDIRAEGVAFDWHEAIDGFGSISAPIIVNNTVKGALSIAGVTTRLAENWEESELAEMVKAGKSEVELNMMYPQRDLQHSV